MHVEGYSCSRTVWARCHCHTSMLNRGERGANSPCEAESVVEREAKNHNTH